MASVANAIGGAVGSAAGAAASPFTSVVGGLTSLAEKALDFIPDPQKKMELQAHAMDLQAQAMQAELDARTKQIQASMQASAGDKSLWKVRAGFCWMVTLGLAANIIIFPLMHAIWKIDIAPYNFPTNLLVMFAAIMLGMVGVPEGFNALRSLVDMVPNVMGMPGESQVSVMGIKVGNKS